MSAAKTKTIAAFGATGGVVGSSLARALRAGHFANALARNPEKLFNSLITSHNVPVQTLDKYLTIVEGDVRDRAAVAQTLLVKRTTDRDDDAEDNDIARDVADVILSGIGSFPYFQWSIRTPFPLRDPTITEDGVATIFGALDDIFAGTFSGKSAANRDEGGMTRRRRPSAPGKKPLLVVVSTAGASRTQAIPWPIRWLYNYLLGPPLADKIKMEQLVMSDQGRHVQDFVIMRPLILTAGGATEEGWEWGLSDAGARDGQSLREREPGPVVGYFVSREDVGKFIFEKVVGAANVMIL
ncbi:uncharacterized protein B0I36DRAFT_430049 [Microdochium trichocladiopsis]|uniref:NAD(P)-binding domain-containing protein n=1 Tax=Microdochium trichocladiopsis TaxID=1682393 RepID=A0A9P9BUT4_9PEZI|nr:uncharacterized protein B0I36DRAFT_430049 [Microdochium trichocladiopsis]KAH7032622.1 hypothetical protein B0I36DRAFT_430049 [Microdochium trichocladiopsis]